MPFATAITQDDVRSFKTLITLVHAREAAERAFETNCSLNTVVPSFVERSNIQDHLANILPEQGAPVELSTLRWVTAQLSNWVRRPVRINDTLPTWILFFRELCTDQLLNSECSIGDSVGNGFSVYTVMLNNERVQIVQAVRFYDQKTAVFAYLKPEVTAAATLRKRKLCDVDGACVVSVLVTKPDSRTTTPVKQKIRQCVTPPVLKRMRSCPAPIHFSRTPLHGEEEYIDEPVDIVSPPCTPEAQIRHRPKSPNVFYPHALHF